MKFFAVPKHRELTGMEKRGAGQQGTEKPHFKVAIFQEFSYNHRMSAYIIQIFSEIDL